MSNHRIKATIQASGDGNKPLYRQIAFNGHVGYLNAVLKAMEIHTAKNTDYSGGGGPDDDPLANFKGSTELGVNPLLGIFIRMADKFQRLKAFSKNGTLAVANESVDDALTDIANYALLAVALRSEDDVVKEAPQ